MKEKQTKLTLKDAIIQATRKEALTTKGILEAVQKLGFKFSRGSDPLAAIAVVINNRENFIVADGRVTPLPCAVETSITPIAPHGSGLAPLEKSITRLQASIRARTIDLIYDVVELGLVLLKAKQLHQSDHLTRFGASGPSDSTGGDTVRPLQTLGETATGYHSWIESKFPDLNIRTAQRYTNAALNAGFTAESDLKAVARLRKEKALHAKQLSDLYRGPKLLTDSTEPEPEKETYDLIRETIAALGEQCDAIIALREQLKPKQYEAVIDRLHETLQLLTGTKWDQVEGDLKIIHAA